MPHITTKHTLPDCATLRELACNAGASVDKELEAKPFGTSIDGAADFLPFILEHLHKKRTALA